MSASPLELVEATFDAFYRRDKAAWAELVDANIEAIPTDEWPENEIRGADAVWDFLVATDDPWEPSPYELTEVTEGKDFVLCRLRRHMQGKASGVEVDYDYWFKATLAHGKGIRLEWFPSRERALDPPRAEG